MSRTKTTIWAPSHLLRAFLGAVGIALSLALMSCAGSEGPSPSEIDAALASTEGVDEDGGATAEQGASERMADAKAAAPLGGAMGQTSEPQGSAGDGEMSESDQPVTEKPATSTVATFGAGCYWCVEAVLEQVEGVESVVSGFMGGSVENPSYEEVCSGTTGHVEVVHVRFKPEVISYRELLKWFFKLHDPTQVDGQGNDRGPMYRSVVFFHDEAQRIEATKMKAKLNEEAVFPEPVITGIEAASTFYQAKAAHQNYYRNNKDAGYCRVVIAPKLQKLDLDY